MGWRISHNFLSNDLSQDVAGKKSRHVFHLMGMLLDLLFVCSRNKRKLKHDDLDNNTVCFLCLDRSISVHGSQRGGSVWSQNDPIYSTTKMDKTKH